MKYDFQKLKDKLKFLSNALALEINILENKIEVLVYLKTKEITLHFSLLDLIPLLKKVSKLPIPHKIVIKNEEINQLLREAIEQNKSVFNTLFGFKLTLEGDNYKVEK